MSTMTPHDVIDGQALTGLLGRSLLTTQDWPVADLDLLLGVAERLEEMDRLGIHTAMLPDQLAYAMFFDNSTRTKSAWAGAAARLGMAPVIVDGSSTQIAHGETAEETGAMLGMNAHALGIRHDMLLGEGQSFMQEVKAGIDGYLKATQNPRHVPIVNLQCDVDHPTQTLADLAWLREYFGGPAHLAGKKIAVTWAYSPSYAKPLSVPQGLITLLTRFGADVTLAHPRGYDLMPESMGLAMRNAETAGSTFRVVETMEEAFAGADVVYPKSWGPFDLMTERVEATRAKDTAAIKDTEARALARNAENTHWICDDKRMSLTRGGDALYMHCLPADIGSEVAPDVMARHQLNVARQANKKVYIIMALLAVAKVPDLAHRLGRV